MNNKVDHEFQRKSFEDVVPTYLAATTEIGLWKSENYVIEEYFTDKKKKIIDIGCGTGRTTFSLFEKGYTNLVAVDFAQNMIKEAKKINKEKNFDIDFSVQDCKNLNFEDNTFDYGLFSFNGLMQIPQKENRNKALFEIRRVLKENGILFFTTHDRESNNEFREFWENERKCWNLGEQNKRLHEYGDILDISENEGREYFIHIPDKSEIIQSLKETNFKLLKTFQRSALFQENNSVQNFSSDCQFWIVQK